MLDILKWLLTVTVGGFLAFAWQKRGWVFQQKLKRTTDRYDSQIGLTREIFTLVDKRIYASRVYLGYLIDSNEDFLKERERYKSVVFEWNEKISGLVVLAVHRFRNETALSFDDYFPPAFAELDRKLRTSRIKRQNGEALTSELVESIRNDIYLINFRAREFMSEMLAETKKTYKAIEDRPDIKHSNIDDVSHWYLLKSLFKVRSNA